MPKFIEWLKLYSMIKLKLETGASASASGNTSGSKRALDTEGQFVGMNVVFTGVRNADMEKIVTDGGGIIGSTITGKTTLVVAKDITENSGKIKTAREKGIQLMNINDFGDFIKYNK